MSRKRANKAAVKRDQRDARTLAAKFAEMESDQWDRGCTGKARYPTKGKATNAVGRFRSRGLDTHPDRKMGAYKCKCGGWHIGHEPYRRPSD